MGNRHCLSDFGLIQDGPRVGFTPAGEGKLRLNVFAKSKRRTVNANPKCVRNGKENPKHKLRRTNKSYNFQAATINDKNAMNRTKNGCPMVRRRITKLHRANCRAAKNAKSE